MGKDVIAAGWDADVPGAMSAGESCGRLEIGHSILVR